MCLVSRLSWLTLICALGRLSRTHTQSLGALGAPGSEAWAAAAAAALSGDQGGFEFIMTIPFVLFRNATPGQGSADDDDAFFGVTWLQPEQFNETDRSSFVLPGVAKRLPAEGAWQVTLVGAFDAASVLDTAVRIDSFYLDPDDPDKLTYQALAPSNLDTSVGVRFCTRVEADNGDDKASPPDGPAATSVCGEPDIFMSGVTLTSMGACDPDGCPAPTMDNAYCCCEETGSLHFHIVNTGTVTFGG